MNRQIFWYVAMCLAALLLIGCGSGGGSGGSATLHGPSIVGFSPLSGAPGTAVTIAGQGFSNTMNGNTVKFNNVTATVNSATSTQIVAVVPAGATSGPISVATADGTAYSANSFSVLPAATQPPVAPTGVSATAGNARVTVAWSSVSGANSYNIYWSTTSGVTKASGNKLAGVTSPYVHTGLTNGTTIYYVVTAVNNAGESVESAQVSATPAATVPTPPGGVIVVPANAQNSISWNASSGATSYNIYWATTSGVTKATGTKITGVSSPYVHTGLTNGTTYYYVVTAVNTAGESAESAQVSAAPVAPVTPPSAPANVTAMAGNAQTTVSWSTVSGATSYNLYWSTTSGVTKLNGTKITGVASPYVHTGLANGTTYYYVVTAGNANGESAESAQTSAIPTAITNAWSSGTAMPAGRTSSVGAVINGKFYVVGGVPPPGYATTEVDMYDPVANTWTTKAPALTSRAGAGGGVINGKLYVVGGCVSSDCRIGVTGALEVYDPVANTWTSLASIPTPRYNAAVGVINGRLYVAGGGMACPPCGALTVVESYDPATNTWRTEPSMPSGAANTSGAVINNVLYVVGGYDWNISGGVLNSLLAFDPVANTWSVKANLPTARHVVGVAAVNGILYTFGGGTSTAVTAVAEAYDPVANLWTSRASMPAAVYGTGVGVINGRIYAAGGVDNSSTILTTVYIYQP